MLTPALQGFVLGGGLIVAIGAQNAFILRQGLLKQHVFILCLVASICDGLLIIAGVAGFGAFVNANQSLLYYVTLGGAVFLAVYAGMAIRRMMVPNALTLGDGAAPPLRKALSILLAFTLLNPHVYLDTVVLVGGISGQYEGAARTAFAVGAVTASFTWFFSLGYGARWLIPLFAKPVSWRILDGLIALIMALLSFSLFQRAFS